MPHVRDATLSDCAYIGMHMRESDKKEVWEASLDRPMQAALQCYHRSPLYRKCFMAERPVAIWGVATAKGNESHGVPWMLATNALCVHRYAFLMASKRGYKEMLDIRPSLFNFVGADNTTNIDWLKWLGFLVEPETVRLAAGNFRRFYA